MAAEAAPETAGIIKRHAMSRSKAIWIIDLVHTKQSSFWARSLQAHSSSYMASKVTVEPGNLEAKRDMAVMTINSIRVVSATLETNVL